MIRFIVLAVLSAACFIAAPAQAQAHIIPESDAESRWYYVFNHECGEGVTVSCSIRKAYLDCRHPSGWVHSRKCYYQYRESKPRFPGFTSYYRWCDINGILAHTTVTSSSKSCGAWA